MRIRFLLLAAVLMGTAFWTPCRVRGADPANEPGGEAPSRAPSGDENPKASALPEQTPATPDDELSTEAARNETDRLVAAREHLQRGRYDEADEAFRAVVDSQPAPEQQEFVAAVAGLAAVNLARGAWDAAEQRLQAGLERFPESAVMAADLAAVHLSRGRWDEAERLARTSLQHDSANLQARLVLARLKSERGQIDPAIQEFRGFVRYYNQKQPEDAATLLLVAQGAVEYARAESVSQIFHFVLNTLCPDALAADPLAWEASLLSGELLLEKYNEGQALQEFQAALAINPRAAAVHAALARAAIQEGNEEKALEHAQRALDINPALPAALLVQADLLLTAGRLAEAREVLERARTVNPVDQATLVRLAQCELSEQGLPDAVLLEQLLAGRAPEELPAEAQRLATFAGTLRDLMARNPAPGVFLTSLGEFFEQRRRFPQAELCYARAIEKHPRLSAPRTALGLLKMRTGELQAAREILDSAFKADPFHVRVSNMRKVLGVLEGYETLTTEHFLLRFEKQDRLLAGFMADYLEEIYPELTAEFGFEPPARTPFEIYGKTEGESAHAWFSARMVGLPWIQTIGASTGMIVALASPTDSAQPYHWGRVLKHEFSHVISLQMTGFRIPHWFTEALAVRTEGPFFPEEWRRLLLRRAPTHDFFTMATLNQGFQKPRDADDWQAAYCLSRLYARYIEEQYGAEALFRMAHAFGEDLSTDEVVQQMCGRSLEEFEGDFKEYLRGVIDELQQGRVPPGPSLEELQQAYEAQPGDAAAAGQLSLGLWADDPRRNARRARELAEQALEADPKQPAATVVLTRFDLRDRNRDAARDRLQAAFDPQAPHPALVGALGRLQLEDMNWEAAAETFRAGLRAFPRELNWIRGLSFAYIEQGGHADLPGVLEQLAMADVDDLDVRQQLQRLAAREERWADCIAWGRQAMFIDARDAQTHRLLGQAYEQTGDVPRAAKHYAAAAELDPDDADSRRKAEALGAVRAAPGAAR